jgi:hypothetical protein
MKTYVSLLICVLPYLPLCSPLNAAVITELSEILGPASPASPPPIAVTTSIVDNDEIPMMVNFFQLFTGLPITGVNDPVDFVFRVVNSGTGGTTEYLLNQWVVNSTGVPWLYLRYSLSARTTTGLSITVPGLDFDWPDKTTPFIDSTNFSNLTHLPHELLWAGGTAEIGANETTFFAIDVPDIGSDYEIVLRLEVSLPGDLDGDGFVGIDDLNLVLGNWNQNVPSGSAPDPSGNGFVGITDLNAVLGNWNAGTPPSEAANTVPEPGSFLALCVGLLLFGRGRGKGVGG